MLDAVHIRDLIIIRDGKTIIPNLTMRIEPGMIVGLLGPSGSGKTTILRSIVGVQAIAAGSITLLGYAAGSKELRTKIGYFTQSASIYADLTCIENLRYFAQILGQSEISVHEVLELVDLTKNQKQLASSLSGGERARLALATALLGRPELLILDEPTVGLDRLDRLRIWGVWCCVLVVICFVAARVGVDPRWSQGPIWVCNALGHSPNFSLDFVVPAAIRLS